MRGGVQYGGERFGRLADGQSLSSRFNWNKGCHIENLSKVMWLAAAKGGRWRKMESGLPGNLGHRGKRYFPGLSRTIKLGPSSRSGITIEVVSRSRSSKITASLLTADFPLPSPSIPSLHHEFEQRCAISPVRKFIVRPWLIRRWERIYEPVENRTRSFSSAFSR